MEISAIRQHLYQLCSLYMIIELLDIFVFVQCYDVLIELDM